MKKQFQSNLDGMTLGGGSIEHPLSIHSASIGTRWKPRGMQLICTLVLLFTFAIGQMWADSVTFTAADMSEQTSGAKKGKITVYCPTKAGDQQAYKSGSAVKHNAISLGSSADTAVIVPQSGKSVQFRADANYKITGISIFAAANKDSICGEPIVIWAGAVNNTPAYVGTIEAPSRAGTSDPDPIVVTGIPNNATAFALYRRIKYNSSTGVIGSGSNFGRSQQTWNIFSVTVTYESTTPATTYTVTYSAGDGSVKEGKSLPTQAAVAAGTIITLASADDLEKEGKEFDGWLCNINSTKYAAGASYTMTAAATTFTAQWKDPAPKYTVTLMPAGGTCESYTGWTYDDVNNKYTKEVSSGTELALPTFTKANRTFKTWRKAGPTDVTSPITVTADVTLTAVWNATVENVLYSWEGAEGGATETGGTATGSVDGLINVAKSGYYCLQINGNTSYDKYVQITLSGEEKVKTGDKIRYTGFYTNTGTKNAAVKMRASGGTAIFTGANLPRIEEASPRTDTYVVPEGINTASVQITRHQTQTSSFLTKLQIIRPTLVEEANLRTVTFNYNDGVTANVTVEVASGSKVSAPADPTYAHHRFHEWQLGGVAYDFATAVTADITLVADWTQLYSVTYAKGAEDATGDAPTQDELAAGEKFTVAANPFAYDGHDFSTWNDGSADVAPGTEYTMGAANVTLTAQWITATTKVTVTYKDGETTLGSEEITINTGNPVGYATYQTRNLATFDGWYNDPDLAEGHKIADISALTASANVNVYGKWNYQYASSVNIEQWTLDNGKGVSDAQKETQTGALVSLLGTRKFASNIAYDKGNIELDSLNDDPGKTNRNYAYLGLKVKKSGKMLDFRLAKDSYVKVKFGNVAATPKVSINGADYADMELTAGVYSYTATGNDYVSIKTASDGAVVFQQVMINEPIAEVTLPWRVTYNANGGTCATAEAIWSGSALILPDVTPADADHTFAGWYDELMGGVLVGAAGASYNATDNVTLYAHFAPVEYTINYNKGDHGSGPDMIVGSAGWGTEYTAIANPYTADEGYLFAGWTVTGVDGVSTISNLGSFTMPKNDVTLTAIWEDNSKVAKIGDAKYTTLEAALADAANGTIELLRDIDVTAQVEIAAGVTATIDLAGHKIEYTGTSTLPSGVILVHNGASLTIDDSSDPDAGSIVSGADAYAAIALTKAGDDAANPAVLEINGGTFTGDYYAITGNGARHNTQITINAGTFSGAHANDNSAIYHPQQGTLIINGGTFTGYSAAIELRAGTLEINDGTFTATATEYSCNPSGSGTTTVGAAIAIAQHNTQKDIAVTINGGTFEGVKAINEANPQGNPAPAVAMSVTDGDFTGEVSTVDVHEFISGGTYDAPVTNENCATGWVPAPVDPVTGKYTVEPKDGVCLVKITPTSQTKGTQTGLYPDGDELTINLSSGMNLGGSGKYIGVKATENFQEGDVLHLNMSTYQNNQNATAYVYADKDASVFLFDTEEKCDENKDYYITMPAAVNGHKELYIVRTDGNKWNGGPSVMEVTRAMKPMLTAITIDGRDGVIDEANKTVAVQIPYESDLAALTVVPTIVWNEAAASNSIVVNDGSAWIEGANTYKLTDKDGDYTVYTITLTRDVQKHTVSYNTHGGSAVASELVEDGDYLAAAPADPTKEDYIFQYWSEDEDGAEVDVTTVQINADKEFHAVWASDGAIKLLNGATVNHTNFITGVTADETVEFMGNTVNYAKFSGTVSGVNGVKDLTRVIAYNATTNKTKIQISAHNNSTSGRNILVKGLVEGAAEAVDLATIALGNKEDKVSDWIEFDNAENRTIYIMVSSSAGDVYFTQVKVIESGETPMKQAGEAGYSLNLNKGRFFGTASIDLAFEGLNARLSGDYTALNSGYAKLNSTSMSFTVAAPMLLKVTTNNNKTYYVTKGAAGTDNETAKTGISEFDLTAGTWYITAGSSEVQFTNLAFELPKCEKPVITTEPVSKLTFDPGDMTATVVAAEPTEGTLSYQWYNASDDSEVDGATDATLTTTTEGTYYVIVTNSLAGHQDNSTKSDEATLGYRVTNDATLSALSYGGTAITLEDGVYDYDVNLAKGTTDVPALAATATMDGYADVNITDAAEFVSYEAISSVVVTSEDGTDHKTYTVHFYVAHTVATLVDVTENTTWDWSLVTKDANNADITSSGVIVNESESGLIIASYLMGDNFDKIEGNNGAYAIRNGSDKKVYQGANLHFHSTVGGYLSIWAANEGHSMTLNVANEGRDIELATLTGSQVEYKVYVKAGDVRIYNVPASGTSPMRVSKIVFTVKETPDYTRNEMLGNGVYGTICLPNNVPAGAAFGATFYEMAGRNPESGKIVMDEVTALVAGVPYVFEAHGEVINVFYGETHVDAPVNQNGMYGTFTDQTLTELDGIYYFAQRALWGCADLTSLTFPANRAYVKLAEVDYLEPTSSPAPGRRRITFNVNGEKVVTDVENVQTSEINIQKVMINGQIFILRGEKMFDATGRLVK